MMELILRLLAAFILAVCSGELIARLKLPSILGWLIAGMVLGPHAISLMDETLLETSWYEGMIHILECAVGLMIGSELVWKKICKSGRAIVVTTLTQSLGTFFLVSLVFGIVFYFSGLPLYLAFIFGGIALATAPAPALSIVREFRTQGPVTDTLIPMAALDDIVGCVVFFVTIATVAGKLSAGSLPLYMIILVVLLPLLIGGIVGYPAGLALKKEQGKKATLAVLMGFILLASLCGFLINKWVFSGPILNFMLIGMAFSAVFSNMIPEKRLEEIMNGFNPFLGVAMIFVILNLGAPLDYHLIMGAGLFTVIYIVARACGKYFGAYFGAAITHSPETVRRFLGLTLLPHSGVSLVFTGIAVSVLTGPDPESAKVIQGTIAAAAVLNEMIAVIVAKKGFEWAEELKEGTKSSQVQGDSDIPIVITISRQYGSGGREVGKLLAEQLGIPFYDHELIEMAANTSSIDRSFFQNGERKDTGSIFHGISSDTAHNLSLSDKAFLHQAEIIREVADRGPCVIVGRCADAILQGRARVLKIFIYADIEDRKKRVQELYQESTDEMERIDRERESYYNFYSGQIFGDMRNYQICLDSSGIGIEYCVDIIKQVYQSWNQ